MAVRAATMAGLPKPCEISEKCVRWRWMLGSKICCGRVLHSGDLSWLSRSISSLVICLKTKWMQSLKKSSFHLNCEWFVRPFIKSSLILKYSEMENSNLFNTSIEVSQVFVRTTLKYSMVTTFMYYRLL